MTGRAGDGEASDGGADPCVIEGRRGGPGEGSDGGPGVPQGRGDGAELLPVAGVA